MIPVYGVGLPPSGAEFTDAVVCSPSVRVRYHGPLMASGAFPAYRSGIRKWVDAAKSYGQRPTGIIRKHLVPNVSNTVITNASLLIIFRVGALVPRTRRPDHPFVGAGHRRRTERYRHGVVDFDYPGVS